MFHVKHLYYSHSFPSVNSFCYLASFRIHFFYYFLLCFTWNIFITPTLFLLWIRFTISHLLEFIFLLFFIMFHVKHLYNSHSFPSVNSFRYLIWLKIHLLLSVIMFHVKHLYYSHPFPSVNFFSYFTWFKIHSPIC